MNATSKAHALPLQLSLLSILLFLPGILVLERTRSVPPLVGIALLAALLAVSGLTTGLRRLREKPTGKRYGFAVSGAISGVFALVLWTIMVPLLVLFALPAREQEPERPDIEESLRQMRVIVRQVKTFHREQGRMPVKVEELVDRGYLPMRVLYDPRDRLKDAPSYRLMLTEMPPESEWGLHPLLEARFPDDQGRRPIAYADESIRFTP